MNSGAGKPGAAAEPQDAETHQVLNTRRRQLLCAYFGVGPDAIDALAGDLRTVTLRGGEWLFRQGEPAQAVYFLLRGRLQVWISDADDPERIHCVTELGAGESIGEVGLLTGGRRSAGVRAIRDSTVLELDRTAMDHLGREHPAATLRVAAVVANRLQERTARRASYVRSVRSIAVLRLHKAAHVDETANDFAAALDSMGRTRRLGHDQYASENFLDSGAASSPAALNRWLADEEEHHEFVLLEGGPEPDDWSRLAVRHADVLVLIADSTATPDVSALEAELEQRRDLHSSRRLLMLAHPPGQDERSAAAPWLSGRRLDGLLQIRAGHAQDIARAARLSAGRGVGLVLGGGGARGFAHIGVFRALKEFGIPIDWVGGTSIGGVFAAGIAQGISPDEIVARAREAFVRGKPFGDLTLPVVSLLKGRRMRRLTRAMLPGNIEDFCIPFFCTGTNIGKAELEVYEQGSIWRALRASTALPGVFPPAVMNRQLVVDGGVLNNLPVDIMRDKPVDTIIAVDLSRQKEREVSYSEVPGALRLLAGRWVPFVSAPRVPGIMSLMLKAQEVGSLIHARETRRLADLVLEPPVGQYGITDVKSFDNIVKAGYEHALERVGPWLKERAGWDLAAREALP